MITCQAWRKVNRHHRSVHRLSGRPARLRAWVQNQGFPLEGGRDDHFWASCLDQCRRNRASPPPKRTTRNDAQDSGRSGRCFSRRCFRDKAPRARGAGSLSLKQCRLKQRPLRPEGRTPGRSWSPSDRERGSPNDGQESVFEGGGSKAVGSRGGREFTIWCPIHAGGRSWSPSDGGRGALQA